MRSMMKWIAGYGAAGVAMLALDLLWLSFVAPAVYKPALGDLLADRVNITAAALFYAIYVMGVVVLGAQPGLKAQSMAAACLYGAALGFVAYATYDLTNLATLKLWSVKVTVIDIAWGTVMTALASAAAYLAMSAVQAAE
jgi:uncharacterized membrane protein